MRYLRIIKNRLRSLTRRGRQEQELALEIEIHVEQLIRQLVASGMNESMARQEAIRQFGRVELAKEECRDMRRVNLVEDLFRDIGFALRLFRKSPGFTLTAIASLVLGIGANTAMFQLFEAVLLRSLPVARPQELMSVQLKGDGRSGTFRGRNSEVTYSIWDRLRRDQKVFDNVFAYGDAPVNMAPSGELRDVEGLWVSGSFFPALGVRPQIGRLLTTDDDRPGCGWPGAVISHAFWQREFGGDTGVLARSLPIDGRAVPIIGVTPPEFFGVEVGRRFDVALPVCSAPEADLANRRFWFLSVMGRLHPGMTEASARAGIRALAPGVLEATLPPGLPAGQALYKQIQFDVRSAASGQSVFRDSFQRPLVFLLCMVALLLMLACANLANMMLARATAREHEFAVRCSLGAPRWRLVRQVLVESLLLAVTGAGIGALAAPFIGRTALRMMSTQRDPIFLALGSNGRVLAFTIAAACIATLLFGLLPALRAAQANTRGATAGREKLAFRRVLLAAQVALCMVLLTTAFLFSQSFRNLLTTSPGFDSNGILVANVFLSAQRHGPERRAAVIEDLHRRVSALPGVSGVARSFVVPISGSGWDRGVRLRPTDTPQDSNLTSVSEDYFRVMKTPILAGRAFNAGDRVGTQPVAVVNQAFARKFFGGANPVGKTFRLDGPEPPLEIIGLAGDTKYTSLAEDFSPIAYLAASQERPPALKVRFLIRSGGRPESLIGSVRRTVLESDPNLTMRFVVLQAQLEQSVLRERLMAALTGAFGVLGAMLALTGVFGVTAYVVSRRHREFGVRIALGATGSGIVQLILEEMARVLLAGIVAGTLLALAAGKAAAAALYGIRANDLTTFLVVTVLLGVGGLTAAFIPAVRASRVPPVEALRVE